MTDDKLRIFLSYSRRDLEATDVLVDALERSGFEVLIDRRDLPYGEEWQAELADFIRNSDTVIWLVSSHSLSSQWVNWELGEVQRLNKRLVPVAIGPFDWDAVPQALGKLHILPAEGVFDINAHYSSLVDTLLADYDWIKQHSRLGDRAHEWVLSGRRKELLLRGSALKQANQWLEKRPPNAANPDPGTMELIAASHTASKKGQRNWIVSLASLLVVFAGLSAGIAWTSLNLKTQVEKTSVAETQAQEQAKAAEEQAAEANRQAEIAAQKEKEAKLEQEKAEAAQNAAEAAEQLAKNRASQVRRQAAIAEGRACDSVCKGLRNLSEDGETKAALEYAAVAWQQGAIPDRLAERFFRYQLLSFPEQVRLPETPLILTSDRTSAVIEADGRVYESSGMGQYRDNKLDLRVTGASFKFEGVNATWVDADPDGYINDIPYDSQIDEFWISDDGTISILAGMHWSASAGNATRHWIAIETTTGALIGSFESNIYDFSDALRFSADCQSVYVAEMVFSDGASKFRSRGTTLQGVDMYLNPDWPGGLKDATQCGRIEHIAPLDKLEIDALAQDADTGRLFGDGNGIEHSRISLVPYRSFDFDAEEIYMLGLYSDIEFQWDVPTFIKELGPAFSRHGHQPFSKSELNENGDLPLRYFCGSTSRLWVTNDWLMGECHSCGAYNCTIMEVMRFRNGVWQEGGFSASGDLTDAIQLHSGWIREGIGVSTYMGVFSQPAGTNTCEFSIDGERFYCLSGKRVSRYAVAGEIPNRYLAPEERTVDLPITPAPMSDELANHDYESSCIYYADDRALIFSLNTQLYRADFDTGEVLWSSLQESLGLWSPETAPMSVNGPRFCPQWSASDSELALYSGQSGAIFDIETGTMLLSFETPDAITSVLPLPEALLVNTEGGALKADLRNGDLRKLALYAQLYGGEASLKTIKAAVDQNVLVVH